MRTSIPSGISRGLPDFGVPIFPFTTLGTSCREIFSTRTCSFSALPTVAFTLRPVSRHTDANALVRDFEKRGISYTYTVYAMHRAQQASYEGTFAFESEDWTSLYRDEAGNETERVYPAHRLSGMSGSPVSSMTTKLNFGRSAFTRLRMRPNVSPCRAASTLNYCSAQLPRRAERPSPSMDSLEIRSCAALMVVVMVGFRSKGAVRDGG